MDREAHARRRRQMMQGLQKIGSGLIRLLFIGTLVYFTIKYFAK